jgi:hypothetical protein
MNCRVISFCSLSQNKVLNDVCSQKCRQVSRLRNKQSRPPHFAGDTVVDFYSQAEGQVPYSG